jgi:hypothetical protein
VAAGSLSAQARAVAESRLRLSWLLVFVPGLLALVAQGLAHLVTKAPLMSDATRATVWGMGLAVWLMVLLFGSRHVAGAINLVAGDVSIVQAEVQGDAHNMGRSCRNVVVVAVSGVPAGERVCVSESQWNRGSAGDGVRVVTVGSALGHEDGLASGGFRRGLGGSQ